MTNSEARQQIYDYLKSIDGWVNIDAVANEFKMCRKIILIHFAIMDRNVSGLYDGIKKRTKRSKNQWAPVKASAKYKILLRVN